MNKNYNFFICCFWCPGWTQEAFLSKSCLESNAQVPPKPGYAVKQTFGVNIAMLKQCNIQRNYKSSAQLCDNVATEYTSGIEPQPMNLCPAQRMVQSLESLSLGNLSLKSLSLWCLSLESLGLWGFSLDSFCLTIFASLSRWVQSSTKPCFYQTCLQCFPCNPRAYHSSHANQTLDLVLQRRPNLLLDCIWPQLLNRYFLKVLPFREIYIFQCRSE